MTLDVVADTTVLIDHLRGDRRAHDWLRSLDAPPLCSELTRTEILVGVRPAEQGAAERLFSVLRWVEVDERIARSAGELGQRYLPSHRLGLAELVIAATALQHDAVVATGNLRHFPMFERLARPY
ncbi:MAG: type II toxin-antitoxin system VapC family toxin [Acidimicrobiia bacterium]